MAQIDERAAAVREFNRFYTRRIGALGGHLGSRFSLTEARVLYELAHRDQPTATEIAEALDLDPGYLSRVLQSFKKRGLVGTAVAAHDRRQALLRLTAAGRRAFAPLDKRAHADTLQMLEPLAGDQQQRVLQAMHEIRDALSTSREGRVAPSASRASRASRTTNASNPSSAPYTLRAHQTGDMGWIVHRHGVLYSREYGWDERFEAIVARVVADFIDNLDPARERCWIAERNGEIVGSIFVVAKSKTVAKLRLLLVEPSARGLGIGARLVDEVIRFAREAGYKKIVLWTHPELVAARKIYKAAGFELVDEETHTLFGAPHVAETWSMTL